MNADYERGFRAGVAAVIAGEVEVYLKSFDAGGVKHGEPYEVELKIERMLSGIAWEATTGLRIMDPDGWRRAGKTMDDMISESEFKQYARGSTCSLTPEAFAYLETPETT